MSIIQAMRRWLNLLFWPKSAIKPKVSPFKVCQILIYVYLVGGWLINVGRSFTQLANAATSSLIKLTICGD